MTSSSPNEPPRSQFRPKCGINSVNYRDMSGEINELLVAVVVRNTCKEFEPR